MDARVAAFVSRRWGVPEASLRVQVQPLRGGLESAVARARILRGAHHGSVPARMVVKELQAGFEREADVYELLWQHLEDPPVVQLLGRERADRATYLFLEDVSARTSWPWSDTSPAAAVCRELARLHDIDLPPALFSWDYEAELTASALATLDMARTARDASGQRYWRRLGDLARVVSALRDIRAHLLSEGKVVIHGDVHPGNVIVRGGSRNSEVVLIDWGRARIGSPLEDISSWLHSLGCWEPEARRRHDTLMAAYLQARTVARRFGRGLRHDYWRASASNGLAGAIRYHLAVLTNAESTRRCRVRSRLALTAWERVVRRAAAILSISRSG